MCCLCYTRRSGLCVTDTQDFVEALQGPAVTSSSVHDWELLSSIRLVVFNPLPQTQRHTQISAVQHGANSESSEEPAGGQKSIAQLRAANVYKVLSCYV